MTRFCRGCANEAEVAPGTALPPGWYGVSVSTALDSHPPPKAYRWLGMFCSVACLVARTPEWQAKEERQHANRNAGPDLSGEELAELIQERGL